MTVAEPGWLKASQSANEGNCVELAPHGAVRDSKNPTGPVLSVDVAALVAAVKAGHVSQ